MVTRGTALKWNNYVLIPFKMLSKMNNNTSDIVQKMVMC